MATYYAFNQNIDEKVCNYGDSVEWNINGIRVEVFGGADGKARLNISPYLQGLFGPLDVNTNTNLTLQRNFTLDGATHIVKYGYCEPGMSGWGNSVKKYNAQSEVGVNQVLIRFYDHYGDEGYWVFDKGSHSVTDGTSGEMLNAIVEGTQNISRPQIKTNSMSQNICAPLVTEEEFDYLCDIKRSINVCANMGGYWAPVVVTTGTNTWVRDDKSRVLQDFELTINLPENSISL